jgi:aspartyl-tRNA(Asn)/glutamyl-tRNA(Gln) amidotransferase subunit B
MKYETVIGLEVHLQLNTKTKAFCGCAIDFGKAPNSSVCPVCLGFPGTLPVYNKAALNSAIKVALALNCQIQKYTKFDRKNYFYPDLPKNYQISQYDLPLSRNGYLDIFSQDKPKRIGITRVHLEEDAGKLIHETGISLVDFNRTGIPLLEIVSEPDLSSPQDAFDYLTSLKSIIEYLDVSDCDMEKGSLRCDANISLRPQGAKELGVKTELKNMNSFKGVKDALAFEIVRQTELLQTNQKMVQETRLWDAEKGATVAMRTKEGAQDYRYFSDPDLVVFIIDQPMIDQLKALLPELPQEKMRRWVNDYLLSEYDVKILTSSKKFADYAEECIKIFPDKNKKPIANWLIGPFISVLSTRPIENREVYIDAKKFVELVELVEKKQIISNLTGKVVLENMFATGNTASSIISEKNLAQISDTGSLNQIIGTVISENEKSVADFKAGKINALMFLVGQVMKKSSGKANPKLVGELIKRRIS